MREDLSVLTVNKMYPPEIGGVEVVAREIAELVYSLDYKSRVITLSPDGKTREETTNGVEILRCGTFFRKDPIRLSLSFKSAYKTLSEKSAIEIFHVPSGLPEFICKKKRNDIERIVLYHADTVSRGITGNLYVKHALAPMLESADVIVATSPKMFETSEVLKKFRAKGRVIPLFVDTDHFLPSGNVFDYSPHFNRQGKKIVLYVGRFGRYKGLDYLLKAMNLIEDRYHLVLIGDGPEKDRLTSLIDELNLKNRVTMMPHVAYSKLPEIYRSADVFVLPSTDRGEAFGLVALEAMACGTPVITTELGTGTTFHNRHGITGYHVAPKDEKALAKAIKQCIEENLKEKNAHLIRQRAEEFSIDKFRKTWEELIISLTKGDRRSETS